jgi:hypothetical protein
MISKAGIWIGAVRRAAIEYFHVRERQPKVIHRYSPSFRRVAAYRWPILFFVAVAFWKLVRAGLFGFLINPPSRLEANLGERGARYVVRAGSRMLPAQPWLSLRHLLEGWFRLCR